MTKPESDVLTLGPELKAVERPEEASGVVERLRAAARRWRDGDARLEDPAPTSDFLARFAPQAIPARGAPGPGLRNVLIVASAAPVAFLAVFVTALGMFGERPSARSAEAGSLPSQTSSLSQPLGNERRNGDGRTGHAASGRAQATGAMAATNASFGAPGQRVSAMSLDGEHLAVHLDGADDIVVFDVRSGKVVSTIPIAPAVDAGIFVVTP